jgi:hypothetical protein
VNSNGNYNLPIFPIATINSAKLFAISAKPFTPHPNPKFRSYRQAQRHCSSEISGQGSGISQWYNPIPTLADEVAHLPP